MLADSILKNAILILRVNHSCVLDSIPWILPVKCDDREDRNSRGFALKCE